MSVQTINGISVTTLLVVNGKVYPDGSYIQADDNGTVWLYVPNNGQNPNSYFDQVGSISATDLIQVQINGVKYANGTYVTPQGHIYVPDGTADDNGNPNFTDVGLVQPAGTSTGGTSTGGTSTGGTSTGGTSTGGTNTGTGGTNTGTASNTGPGRGIYANQKGTWKKITNPQINQNGSWVPIIGGWVKAGGSWQQYFPYYGIAYWNQPGQKAQWTVPPGIESINVTLIGGGGGGGTGKGPGRPGGGGGGGGGGSVFQQTGVRVQPGETYSITVGKGGQPGQLATGQSGQAGTDSSIEGPSGLYIAYGGGPGGGVTSPPFSQGGSGGGGAASGDTGTQNGAYAGQGGGAGGSGWTDSKTTDFGGGGGGAGGNGFDAVGGQHAGNGGPGLTLKLLDSTGTTKSFDVGGGGAGGHHPTVASMDGIATHGGGNSSKDATNYGGGGGGGGAGGDTGAGAGAGGVVVISWGSLNLNAVPYIPYTGTTGQGSTLITTTSGNSDVTEIISIPYLAPPTGFPVKFSKGVPNTDIQLSLDSGKTYKLIAPFGVDGTYTWQVGSPTALLSIGTFTVRFKFIGTGHITGDYTVIIQSGAAITYPNGGTSTGGTSTGGTSTGGTSTGGTSTGGTSTGTGGTTTGGTTVIRESITVPKTAPTSGFNVSFSAGVPGSQIQVSINGGSYQNIDKTIKNGGLFDIYGNYLWQFSSGAVSAGKYTLQFKFLGTGDISQVFTVEVSEGASITLTEADSTVITVTLSNNPPIAGTTGIKIDGLSSVDAINYRILGTSGIVNSGKYSTNLNVDIPLGSFTLILELGTVGVDINQYRAQAIITGTAVSAAQAASGTATQCTISFTGSATFKLTPAPGTSPNSNNNTNNNTNTPPSMNVSPAYGISSNPISGNPPITFNFTASNLNKSNRYIYYFGYTDHNDITTIKDDFAPNQNTGWIYGADNALIETNPVNGSPLHFSIPNAAVIKITSTNGTASATLNYTGRYQDGFFPSHSDGSFWFSITPTLYAIDQLGGSGALYDIVTVATPPIAGFTGESAAERRVYSASTIGVTLNTSTGSHTNTPTSQSTSGSGLATVSFGAVSTKVAPGGKFILNYAITFPNVSYSQNLTYPLYLTLIEGTNVQGTNFPVLGDASSKGDASPYVSISSFAKPGQTTSTYDISLTKGWQDTGTAISAGNTDFKKTASGDAPGAASGQIGRSYFVSFDVPNYVLTGDKKNYYTQGYIELDIPTTSVGGSFSLTLWGSPTKFVDSTGYGFNIPYVSPTTIQCAVSNDGSLTQTAPTVAGANGTFDVNITGWDNKNSSPWLPPDMYPAINVTVTLSTPAKGYYQGPNPNNDYANTLFRIPLVLTIAGKTFNYFADVSFVPTESYEFSGPITSILRDLNVMNLTSTNYCTITVAGAFLTFNGYNLGKVTGWSQSSLAPSKYTISVGSSAIAYQASTTVTVTVDQAFPIDYSWDLPYGSTIPGVPDGSVTINFTSGQKTGTGTFSAKNANNPGPQGGGTVTFNYKNIIYDPSKYYPISINLYSTVPTITMSPSTTPPKESATVKIPTDTPSSGFTISITNWNGPKNSAVYVSTDGGTTKTPFGTGTFDDNNSVSGDFKNVPPNQYKINFYADNWTSDVYTINVPKPSTSTTVTTTTGGGTTITGTVVTYNPKVILPKSSELVVNNNWPLTINGGPPNTTCTVQFKQPDVDSSFYINSDSSGNNPPKSDSNGTVTVSVKSQYSGSFTVSVSFKDGTTVEGSGSIDVGQSQQSTDTYTNSTTTGIGTSTTTDATGTTTTTTTTTTTGTTTTTTGTTTVTNDPTWLASLTKAWQAGDIYTINSIIYSNQLTQSDLQTQLSLTDNDISWIISQGVVFYYPYDNSGSG
jgi:hypothetical protein